MIRLSMSHLSPLQRNVIKCVLKPKMTHLKDPPKNITNKSTRDYYPHIPIKSNNEKNIPTNTTVVEIAQLIT